MKKRWLAILMAVMMAISLLPTAAWAEKTPTEGSGSAPSSAKTIYVDAAKGDDAKGDGSENDPYQSVGKAARIAESGSTIYLAAGTYTLYDIDSANTTKGKTLTFVGAGADKTIWQIGADTPKGNNGEYDSDYSFKGSTSVTFKYMTLRTGATGADENYLGFSHTNVTVVENCTLEGRTAYWGYESATFKNCIFNCPTGNYAIWTYSSPTMTFEDCTFNSSGKVINVYTDFGAGKNDIKVNYKNCTVKNQGDSLKPVLNINDYNMGAYKYILNISGDNVVSGVKADGITCSRLFGFGGKAANNTGRSVVTINDVKVWENGKRAVEHNCVGFNAGSYDDGINTNDTQYTDGYKDDAFTTTYGSWGWNQSENKLARTVTTTCNYCGYVKNSTEYKDLVLDVSRSKTATQLDKSTWTSNVTLSLPSAEENLATDVVLVLDASKCTKDMLNATIKLLKNLESQVKSGANIKVGIVMYKGNAVPFRPLAEGADLASLYTTFTTLIQADDADGQKTKAAVRAYVAETYPNFMNGGTNIPAGLQLAKNMLEGDTAVTDARKYMVLVSDGDTYLFCHKDDEENGYDYTKAYTRAGPSKGYIGGISEYENYDTGVPVRDKYLSAKESLDKSVWKDYLDYVGKNNSNFTKYDFQASAEAFDAGTFPDGFTDDTLIPETVKDRIINSDVSRYQTEELYSKLQEKYNCYYCFLPGGYDMARTMLKAFTPTDHLIDAQNSDGNPFESITADIIYAVAAGSKVEDKIGNAFTLDVNSFKLTVGGDKIEGTPDTSDANTVNFGNVKNDGNYPYTITYTPATKTFVWTINEDVSNFAPVQLSYTVKLTKPETAAGTYGVTDLNGDTIIDGTNDKVEPKNALYTNDHATLTPKDSAGRTGTPVDFPKPSVSYTVRSSGGGGGGGNNRPTLNTEDHFGYIIGYPVDYFTGEPTTDQTKKPVRPQGEITRAEVATIFFRMLTDESRTQYWSQENSYSDVAQGQWFNAAVSTLSKAGIISGYPDGSFRPNGSITRAEFATIAVRFFDVQYDGAHLFPDIDGHWAQDYIDQAGSAGLVNGYPDGTFGPDRSITRAEAVTLVNRTLDRHPDPEHFLKDMLVWPDNMDTKAWYYADMQEATNSHQYEMKTDSDKTKHEVWTKMLPIRDWEAFEKAWSDAGSASNPGEVVNK